MAERNRWDYERYNRDDRFGERDRGDRDRNDERNLTGRDFMTNQPRHQGYAEMDDRPRGSREEQYGNQWNDENRRRLSGSSDEHRWGSGTEDRNRFSGYREDFDRNRFSGNREDFDRNRGYNFDRDRERNRFNFDRGDQDRDAGNREFGYTRGGVGNYAGSEDAEQYGRGGAYFRGREYGGSAGQGDPGSRYGSRNDMSGSPRSNWGGGYTGGGYGGGEYRSRNESWTDRDRGRNYGENRWDADRGDRDDRSWGEAVRDFFGIGPKGWTRSDDRIRDDVSEKLEEDPRIDASNIEVRVSNAEVTLTGNVRDRNTKRLAEEVAENCRGVRDVHNQIRVESRFGQTGASSITGATGTTGSTGTGSTPGSTTGGSTDTGTPPSGGRRNVA